jgi:hypothetical protein
MYLVVVIIMGVGEKNSTSLVVDAHTLTNITLLLSPSIIWLRTGFQQLGSAEFVPRTYLPT